LQIALQKFSIPLQNEQEYKRKKDMGETKELTVSGWRKEQG